MNSISILDYISTTKYKEYLVIDVRSDDFIGGNIIGAINIPSNQYNKIKLFVENKNNIIIHCMYSSIRGPGVVKRLVKDYPEKNIILLEGGFNKYFNEVIKINKTLIENYDLTCWNFSKEWKHKND